MFRGEANPRSRSSLASVSLLDRNPGIERLRSTFDRASRNVLRLRQRIVAPALPITGAEWIVDPDFDLGYHVRAVRATAPGGLRELLDLTTALLSTPLDTARPLWEALLVEDVDVDGACAALVMKVSHSLTDGEGALQLLTQLFDFERDADRGPMPPVAGPGGQEPHRPGPDGPHPWNRTSGGARRAPAWAWPPEAWRAPSATPAARSEAPEPWSAPCDGSWVIRPHRPRRSCSAVASVAVSTRPASRSTVCATRPVPRGARSTTPTSRRSAVRCASTTSTSACRSTRCPSPCRSVAGPTTTPPAGTASAPPGSRRRSP